MFDISKQLILFFLGCIFIFTALHRVYLMLYYKNDDYRSPHYEVVNTFGIHEYSKYVVVIVEIIVGLLLLLPIVNMQIKKYVICFLASFMLLSSIVIVVRKYDEIKSSYLDVFTYQPTFVAFFLHITYFVLCINWLF